MASTFHRDFGKLFVGNVAWGTTDNELKEFFGQYGELQDAYFPKDDQGRTKGFGFIELEEIDADKIIQEANGRDFNGRELRVDVANAREDRPRREFRPRREGGSDRAYRPRRDNDFNRGGDRDRSFDRPRRDSNDE
ncbi:hypothetical protein BG011_008981 [Mortierella polycephala]|uniref:RRM domain-containing protein n=1 Tax=Mortierella polycephala TaxID=41804 RepID=A0A9P6PNX5_9FUNG|nr:hypothetical protein BG011_008981 [Mortierella polycephala]